MPRLDSLKAHALVDRVAGGAGLQPGPLGAATESVADRPTRDGGTIAPTPGCGQPGQPWASCWTCALSPRRPCPGMVRISPCPLVIGKMGKMLLRIHFRLEEPPVVSRVRKGAVGLGKGMSVEDATLLLIYD